MNPIAELRLTLLRAGYESLPIMNRQKRPPMEKWSRLRPTEDDIARWNVEWPNAKNTGILTRLMPTFDIDVMNPDAAADVEQLVRSRYGERGYILPRVGKAPKRAIPFQTDTPFKKLSTEFVGTTDRLEFLGDGGQVVCFGLHKETRKPYSWIAGEPGKIKRHDLPRITEAEARELLEAATTLLTERHGYVRTRERPKGNGHDGGKAGGAADWAHLTENILAGRGLHDALRDLAGKLVRSGMSKGASVNYLRALLDASTAPHDERWQARRNDIPRLVDSAGPEPDPKPGPEPSAGPEPQPEPHSEPEPDPEPQPQPEQPKAKRHRFELKPQESITMTIACGYLVKGVLPRVGLGVVWGSPKCGKSFWTFDLSMHVATGRNYRGHKTQQGAVIYFALEGSSGFARRVEAWRRRHLAEDHDPVPFWLLDVPLDLVRDRNELIQAIRDQLSQPPAMIVIDTLNRCIAGDENSSEDMAKFIRAADGFRTAFDCLVLIIHHCGVAGSRPRGHTSLAGADDTQIEISRDKDGIITATVEHAKDFEAGAVFASKLESVELGNDEDGDPITSCIIVPIDAADVGPKLSKHAELGQETLRKLLASIVDSIPAPEDAYLAPGTRICRNERWRQQFYDSHWSDRQDTRKKSFQRAHQELVLEHKLIDVFREYVFFSRDKRDNSSS
jgi:hypothetical protein